MKLPLQIIITGTDTEVGKTEFSKLLLNFFLKQNEKTLYIKPFQSGTDADADYIAKNSSLPKKNIRVLESWNLPAAPDCANFYAESPKNYYYENALLETKKIINENQNRSIIIEGAGGILVPIDKDKMMVDFFQEINLPVILVAKTGLGTVNHTLLTIDFLTKKKIKVVAIFLNDFFASAEEKINSYNQKIIFEKTGIKVFRFLEELNL